MWEILCQLLDPGLFQKVPQEKGEREEIQEEGQDCFSAGDMTSTHVLQHLSV